MAPSVAQNPTSATVDRGGGGTPGFQPKTSPVSDAKRNRAGAEAPPAETAKSAVGLKTWPVGFPCGRVTLNAWLSGVTPTSPMYSSLRPPPLDDTQNAPRS